MLKEKTDQAQLAISLLYPPGYGEHESFQHWGENTPSDLGVEALVRKLSYDRKYEASVKNILLELCPEPDVIAYRQEVLQDFIEHPSLAPQFAEVLTSLARLHDAADRQTAGPIFSLHQTMGRMTELNNYVQVIRKMRSILRDETLNLRSQGLKNLDKMLSQIESEEIFQSLAENLPGIVARLGGIPSITIGVNLDSEFMPVEAMLLSVNDKPFKDSSLLDRLVQSKSNRRENQGVGPLHTVGEHYVQGMAGQTVKSGSRRDPLMVPLFRDLYDIIKSVITPIETVLRRYAHVQARRLLPLENEIAFYLGALTLLRQLQDYGLPLCQPEILPMTERAMRLDGMFNLLLAFHHLNTGQKNKMSLVLNDVEFGPDGRIFILTGPNQGGKTVYTQAIGITQLLFQAGLFVPARQAQISPVDGIYTHFASEEEFNSRQGRLSEEAARLAEIFQTLTRHGMVLLNESLSSTSPRESFYLSLDIVRALRLYQARSVFATHLHELAENLDKLNAEGQSDSLVASLVAEVAQKSEDLESENRFIERTYQIKLGPPRGLSYAKGIAHRFGISYEQLAAQKIGALRE
jgi:DNA mismatch repair protein MutS